MDSPSDMKSAPDLIKIIKELFKKKPKEVNTDEYQGHQEPKYNPHIMILNSVEVCPKCREPLEVKK